MRTENSIKNVFTIIVPYFIIGVLGFVKSKVFYVNLEVDIYSLNQLFFQIMGYFSLAEAGFEAFIAQKYYDAFSKGDNDRINSIFGTSKIYFKWIGIVIMAAATIVMFFVHYLTKAQVDITYIRVVFMLFVVKNSVDYFMMCPRIVINSDQKAFKINLLVNGCRILENVADIVLVLLGVDYLIILIPGTFIRIIFNLIINRVVYKEYPWLQRRKLKFEGKHIKGLHHLIYQRIAYILNSNTDIILVSAFVNPLSVIIYTSYNYVTKFVNDTLYVIAGALTPSFANALYDGDTDKGRALFKEMNIAFYFMATFAASVFFLALDPFVALWMDGQCVITTAGLVLMIYIMFDNVCKRPVNIVINSLGIFKETKVPVIIECVLNFAVSIITVQYLGLTGVLLGTVVASLCTTWWFNPKYICNKIFKMSVFGYYRDYVLSAVCVVGLVFILKQIPMLAMTTWSGWLIASIAYALIAFIILFVIFYFCTDSFKNIINRLLSEVKGKIRKAK